MACVQKFRGCKPAQWYGQSGGWLLLGTVTEGTDLRDTPGRSHAAPGVSLLWAGYTSKSPGQTAAGHPILTPSSSCSQPRAHSAQGSLSPSLCVLCADGGSSWHPLTAFSAISCPCAPPFTPPPSGLSDTQPYHCAPAPAPTWGPPVLLPRRTSAPAHIPMLLGPRLPSVLARGSAFLGSVSPRTGGGLSPCSSQLELDCLRTRPGP